MNRKKQAKLGLKMKYQPTKMKSKNQKPNWKWELGALHTKLSKIEAKTNQISDSKSNPIQPKIEPNLT